MAKRFVFILLTIHLFASTELSQFLKVPVLVEHFIEHKNQDVSMSFMEYLIHHYGGHEMDEDWETDMKLPFMKHIEIVHFIFVIQKALVIVTESNFELIASAVKFIPTSDFFTSESITTVFQPPRL